VSKAILLASAISMLTACNGNSEPEHTTIVRTAADRGALLFQDPSLGVLGNTFSCATCHESTRGDAGKAILPGAPLAGVTRRPSYWAGQETELLRAVNDCLLFFMIRGAPWTAEDPAAQATYAYLDQLPDDGEGAKPVSFTVVVYPPPDPVDGDATRGADLYARTCRTCHGALHTGAMRLTISAPILPEDVLATHPPPTYKPADQRRVFADKVRSGPFFGQRGQMPLFSSEKLSEQDVGDLIAYIDPK
jgi:thiosulfate dehydrogenase